MADQTPPAEEERVIVIDGVEMSDAKLTFREQRELRDKVRELAGDETLSVDEATFVDYLPALAYVVRKRDNAEYTLDEALDCAPEDFLVPKSKLPKRRRPTQTKTP